VVIVGLAAWFALSDLGIGYAAQNAITDRLTKSGDAAEEVLSAYLMLAFATSAVVLTLYMFRSTIAITLFGKLLTGADREVGETFFHSALILILGAALGLSTKVLYAMHRGYVANFVAAIAPIVGLSLLVVGIASAEDKVTFAVLALYGPNAIACCALAARQILAAAQKRSTTLITAFTKIAKASPGFLLFNALGAAVMQIDYFVMSQKVSAVEIIQYFTIGKIFSFVAFFNNAILFAAWPTLTALYSAGDLLAIRVQIKRLIIISSSVTFAATVSVLLTQDYLGAFLAPGKDIDLRTTVILGFGAVALIRCFTDPFAIFLQSVGKLTPLIVFAGIQAVCCASLQWVLVDLFGIEGILLALLLSFVLTTAWALPLASRKLLLDGSEYRSEFNEIKEE